MKFTSTIRFKKNLMGCAIFLKLKSNRFEVVDALTVEHPEAHDIRGFYLAVERPILGPLTVRQEES